MLLMLCCRNIKRTQLDSGFTFIIIFRKYRTFMPNHVIWLYLFVTPPPLKILSDISVLVTFQEMTAAGVMCESSSLLVMLCVNVSSGEHRQVAQGVGRLQVSLHPGCSCPSKAVLRTTSLPT